LVALSIFGVSGLVLLPFVRESQVLLSLMIGRVALSQFVSHHEIKVLSDKREVNTVAFKRRGSNCRFSHGTATVAASIFTSFFDG
jgi:hypothetical protein